MTVLIVITSIIFLVLIGWMWHSLGNIETLTKIGCIVGGLIAVYILTFIIFNISRIGINYESIETMKAIRRVYVVLLTIVNGYVILPFVFRKLNQINNEEIEKEKVLKSLIILAIIIVILFIFEIIYFGNIQGNILSMAK